jgi:hypothetical protein
VSLAPDLRDLGQDGPRLAVEIYMRIAYPSGTWPEAVQRRLAWPEGVSLHDILAIDAFERARSTTPGGGPIYALRLGNRVYPHMKLQIQPWPSAAGYLLSVNTHDQVANLDPTAPDAAAFRALQAQNQEIKEAIEQAWDEQSLPTFRRYLLNYLAENRPPLESKPGAGAGPESPPV